MSTATVTGRRPLDADDYDRIEQMALDGYSKSRASAELGVSFESLTRWLIAHGCEDWFSQPQSWALAELRFHVDSGVRLADIAQRLGYKNEESARRLLRKHDPRLLAQYDRLK